MLIKTLYLQIVSNAIYSVTSVTHYTRKSIKQNVAIALAQHLFHDNYILCIHFCSKHYDPLLC